MAAFTTAQLATLPHDLLLRHIVPMLANAETPEQRSDRIAQEATDWAAYRWNERITSLPFFVPMGTTYRDIYVHDAPLSAFCVFGAQEEVPFSVWRILAAFDREDSNPELMKRYACLGYYRRVQQRKVVWTDEYPPAEESEPESEDEPEEEDEPVQAGEIRVW